ncbi:hypothetical protein LTS17_005008 [Exophiala oligosperma]
MTSITISDRFSAAPHVNDGKHHILLGASGSVATIKIPNIAQALAQHPKVSIRIVLTRSAEEFLRGQSAEQPLLESLQKLPNVDGIYHDEDEWSKPWVRGDSILHIELRRWAHVMLVAPLSANTMAKMVNGIKEDIRRTCDEHCDVEASDHKKADQSAGTGLGKR